MVSALKYFMDYLLNPISFLVILLVLFKIIRTVNSHTSLIMFYGKQIEELRKMAAGGSQSRRVPEVSPEDSGLYEVLSE
jgi:hypothetical protein